MQISGYFLHLCRFPYVFVNVRKYLEMLLHTYKSDYAHADSDTVTQLPTHIVLVSFDFFCLAADLRYFRGKIGRKGQILKSKSKKNADA